MLGQNLSFYDILEIAPDASKEEIREAYLRIKSTYHRDHVALYTLFSAIEREEILKKAEEAYLTLSDTNKRNTYDQSNGLLTVDGNPFEQARTSPGLNPPPQKPEATFAEVISIDRTPPMESAPEEQLLVSPKTDFALMDGQQSRPFTPPTAQRFSHQFGPHPIETTEPSRIISLSSRKHTKTSPLEPALLLEIEQEREWSGPFLQKVRSATKISIEEMAEITKVSKTYIQAIEEENFKKLPAPVYVRGFVLQIARALRLPTDAVASAYLSRYLRKTTG
jgi:curved DNA-binding protein CbpA